MKFTKLLPHLRTGDLVLSSGSSGFAHHIKQVMGVPFSHSAMIVLGKDCTTFFEGLPGLDPDKVYCWEATGFGVGAVEWSKATVTEGVNFFTRLVNPGAGDVVVRQLIPSANIVEIDRFRLHRGTMTGRPYERDKRAMFRAAFPNLSDLIGTASDEDLSSCFCWEATAAAWKAMGILPEERPAGTYSINDFLGGAVPLIGHTLGDLIPVELSN